jgi:hypothetical protein
MINVNSYYNFYVDSLMAEKGGIKPLSNVSGLSFLIFRKAKFSLQ